MNPMRTIFAATVLAAGLSAEPAMAGSLYLNGQWMDTFDEDSGFAIFGFNIAFAGYTPAAVKKFVAGLNATQKHSVAVGCNEVLRESAASVNSTVLEFCRNYRS